MADDREEYYSTSGLVYAGDYALELDAIWQGIELAETQGIELNAIGRALTANWAAAVIALAFADIERLRALVAEAQL